MVRKFEFKELEMKGAFEITPFYATDERGGFVKDYNIDMFKANGIEHELKEVFYTISKKGVIRAMHFQLVKQQAKLVRCISGHVSTSVLIRLPSASGKALTLPEIIRKPSIYLSSSVMATLCSRILLSAISVVKFSMGKVMLVSATMIPTWASYGLLTRLVASRI